MHAIVKQKFMSKQVTFTLKEKIGTHCVHVVSAVHALRTCLFSSCMPDEIVGRALYSALPKIKEGHAIFMRKST